MEKEEEVKNRIRKDLVERNAEDGSLKANLGSPGNEKKLDLEKINYLNRLVSTYKKDIANPDEARWYEHAKINQAEQINKVYDTPLKKLGRAFAKRFPKSVSAALWSKATKPFVDFKDKVKEQVKNGFKAWASKAGEIFEKLTKPIKSFEDGMIQRAENDNTPIIGNLSKVLAFLVKEVDKGMELRPGVVETQKKDQVFGSEITVSGKVMETFDPAQVLRDKTSQPDQLRDFLKEKQFSSAIPALNEAIDKGDKNFQLQTHKIIGDKVVGYHLNFSKNDNGTIRFNSFEVGMKDEDNPGSYKSAKIGVDGMNTPSSSEAYKLLSGEKIYRKTENANGEVQERLYSLNENDMKNNPHDMRLNEYVVDRKHINDVVNALPHPPGTTEDYKKQLVDDLCEGKKRLIPLEEKGKTNVHIQIGDKPGLMKYFDLNNKPVPYSAVREKLNNPLKTGEKVGQKNGNKQPIRRVPVRHRTKAA